MEEGAELPTVATIIGCPDNLDTEGLVATPLAVPGAMGGEATDEAIQKATMEIMETISRGFVSKKERDRNYCSICDVHCTGEQAWKAHVSGTKHKKKEKDRGAEVDVDNEPFIFEDQINKTFECMLCNIKLNARNQIAAHVQGTKHKARLDPNKELYAASGRNILDPHRKLRYPSYDQSGGEDLSLSLLYCATCDVQANSSFQMEQHMASAKHVNKVNAEGSFLGAGRSSYGAPEPPGRYMPYPRDRDYYDVYERERFERAIRSATELIREYERMGGGDSSYWARERYGAGDDRYRQCYDDYYRNARSGYDRPSGRGKGSY